MKSSLKVKIYGFVAVLLVFLIISLNFIPIISSREVVFEEKKSSLSAQGNVFASALSRIDKLSTKSIKEVIQILDMSDYSQIIVTNIDGQIVYDSISSADPQQYSEDISTSLSGKIVFRSNFKDRAFDSIYLTPVSNNGSITGCLLLRDVDTERAEIILSLQSRIRTVSIVVCILTLILAMLFSNSLMKRISNLVSSIRIVAGGDYKHRLSVSGDDEIAELGNEFNTLTETLETTEIQRRRFVSDASHELKTPLSAIRLLADSIVQSKSIDEATAREFVSDIGDEAERLQHTTENLLNLSRLDDGVFVVPEPVDVKQVVIDAFVFVKPIANERAVKIKCELDDGCIVMATVDDMFHIVFNLMENAVKYNVDGGSVTVRLSSDDEHVTLVFEDTGIGIPEEDRLNVFARFYRVDKARSREAGGSGLGLSIVHDAVVLHNGIITIGPNKPQGSIFTVVFPKAKEEETGI